ncbi:putative guanine deaminase [Triangularia verruculosa]|uniref:Guanine deaminase n=1 Tax=Triangularia verruculosa TaxID=2587418 RepID=A0AAN6XAW7_9PEZI|nr:putative guanine deaminase [Triangularia verruculosa]
MVAAHGQAKTFIGPVIHSLSPSRLEIIPSALLIVDHQGKINTIVKLEQSTSSQQLDQAFNRSPFSLDQVVVIRLEPGQFLIPGFVDTHNHAPQYAQRGLGQGMHILDWLSKITFPNEAKFSDPVYARKIYTACVEGFLRQGITTASYYGSVHTEATKILADICLEKGQRAYVGKCNMTRNSPDSYMDKSAKDSLAETRECISHVKSIDPEGSLVNYVITPRFAISCDEETLRGLGDIARDNEDSAVQTHFNEARQEMEETQRLFPQFGGSEADLYEEFGLLGKRTILAHCCFMDRHEMERVRKLECGVAHCPISNMTVGGGFMAAPVRKFLDNKIKVGLGTDSGGGFSSSMLDAMRQAMIASHAREVMSEGEDKGLSIAEVFYLATLGGATVCCLENKIGSFGEGKEFDGLVIGTHGTEQGIMTMVEEDDTLETVFEKFIMTGDDRNVVEVYIQGKCVKGQRAAETLNEIATP